MSVDRELSSSSTNDSGTVGGSAPLCAMQAWLGDGVGGSISAAEQLRDFTREIREQEDPERWDGLS